MNLAKMKYLGAMTLFGTIGVFVRYIPMSSSAIAFYRGVLGCTYLLLVMLLGRKKPDFAAIRRNFPLLLLSGTAIGFNWILLFEGYKYTTVAAATVCYYLAPLLLLLASPLLGEKITVKKLLCIGVALLGLLFVSGITENGISSLSELKGIALSIGAAVLYATAMFLNKKQSAIGSYDRTLLQLGSATVVLLPYLLLTEGVALPQLTPVPLLLLLTVGIVHTGIAYSFSLDSMAQLSAQTVGIFSYLDPVVAVLLSALLLREPMTLTGIVGTVLILGSALYSEMPERKHE